METFVTYLYLYTQIFVFLLYIPHISKVVKSETADAISVPTQFCFFTIGGIAAIYMIVVNNDSMASLIICGHILVGNLAIALIALAKQRRFRERTKEDKTSQGSHKSEEENP